MKLMVRSGSSGARSPDEWKLAKVKLAHTLIYLVMASSTLFVVYSGISGRVVLTLSVNSNTDGSAGR